jgi:hypothetical protein
VTEKDKRKLLFNTIFKAAQMTYNNLASKIESIFVSHGYFHPSPETIVLKNNLAYKFAAIEDKFLEDVVESLKLKNLSRIVRDEAIEDAASENCLIKQSRSQVPRQIGKSHRRILAGLGGTKKTARVA